MPVDKHVLKECQEALGYQFRDPSLLALALTHASRKSEDIPSNERIEFLGDAVLGMVISEYLFHTHPDLTEGDMTQIKSVVVSRPTLAVESERLGLWRFLSVGKGMESLEELPASLLANVFEAVVGAILLDGGLECARDFVLQNLRSQIELVENDRHSKNYKSMLQEFSQREFGALPTYDLLKEEGPDHMKSFLVVAVIDGKKYETAWGRSKKEAEQNAAMATLRSLRTTEMHRRDTTSKEQGGNS
jgi:ribonuclease-3